MKHAAPTKKRPSPAQLLIAAILAVLAVVLLLPLVFTFCYSFFPKNEIKMILESRGRYDDALWMPLHFTPTEFSLRQYYSVLIEDTTVLHLFINSVAYTAAILIGQAVVVPMTAFALSKFRFRGRDTLFFALLILMVLPFQVTMAPNVITMRTLQLMNSPWAVILPMWFSPFYIFLLRQFMLSVPDELIEAGTIDGAGAMRCYLHIILPACRPALGAAIALSFADCWNLVEQPLIYLGNRQELMPLSVMFNQLSVDGKEIAFAGAALYIVPAILVYLFFQDDIRSGLQLSELK